MHRSTKTLGVALAAAFALSSVTASTASAVTHKFHSNANPTYLASESDPTAGGVHVLRGRSGDVKNIRCSQANLRNSIQEGTEVVQGTFAAESVTVEPIYEECGLYSGDTRLTGATVTTAGCHFALTGETNSEGDAQLLIGHAANECEEGIAVSVLGQVCLHVESEQAVTGVHYNNVTTESGVEEITMELTVGGIKATTTNHPLICPTESGETEKDSTGTFTGNVIVKGFKNLAHSEPANITVSP